MTSRQAKRAYQKQGKKFKFTPSQFRAAERRSELEERRKKIVAAEETRRENKRKREEKDERERHSKKRQLADGKISIEDTWGKVRASQPRLLSFFGKPAAPVTRVATPTPEPEPESEPELESGSEAESENEDSEVLGERSEEETDACEQPVNVAEEVKSPASPATVMISVIKLISQLTRLKLSNLTPQNQQEAPKSQKQRSTPPAAPMDPNADLKVDQEQDLLDAQLTFSQSFWDFVIAEDNVDIDKEILQDRDQHTNLASMPADNSKAASPVTMQPLRTTISPKRKATDSHNSSFCSPSKSMRSVLSEMTRSDVNVRAQEKPDSTSTPKAGSALLSPSPKKDRSAKVETPADVLAMISTQDLEIDLEDALNEKENEDPWRPATKPDSQKLMLGTKDSVHNKLLRSSQIQRKSQLLDEFLDLDDIEDAFFDFENDLSGADEFDDGGAADSIFAQMSTQVVFGKPSAAQESVNLNNPINKILSSPSRTRSGRPFAKVNSFGGDALDDDFLAELTELADKAEAEAAAARPKKKGRTIPWLHRTVSQEAASVVAAKQREDEEVEACLEEFLTPSPELSQV